MMHLLSLALTLAAAEPSCEISQTEREALLEMDFETFDRSDQGWRKYGEYRACYTQTADLIEDYILHAEQPVDAMNIRLLSWHAGSAAAFGGDEVRGLRFFEASYLPGNARSARVDWNSYTDATVAFLKKDRTALVEARTKIAQLKPFDSGYIFTLNVVDGFLKCFEKTYREALSDACMSDGKTP